MDTLLGVLNKYLRMDNEELRDFQERIAALSKGLQDFRAQIAALSKEERLWFAHQFIREGYTDRVILKEKDGKDGGETTILA